MRRTGGRARAAAALLAGLAVLALPGCAGPAPTASCTASAAGGTPVRLTVEQADAAATIAAVGLRLGVPDHAVTVALATAQQESGLRNRDHGDRDSLGLFQQRPSQGWGTREQVRDPVHAARTFYLRLLEVRGWQRLTVAQAAQAVQLSAFPSAYAKHEDGARLLARVLTGEVAAGLTCAGLGDSSGLREGPLLAAADRELGAGRLRRVDRKTRQVAAAWLVAHAAEYGVHEVTSDGRRWTARSGRWVTAADAVLSYA